MAKPTFISNMDMKTEPMDRNSPGPIKTNARKAAASAGNIKTESMNGYGSPQNANDDNGSNSSGLRGGAGGANKRKSRGPAALSVNPKDRDKRAKTAAGSSAAPAQTPASSTGGSSSEDASGSENEVNGKSKKGAGAASKSSAARGVNPLAGRQRNSDSSSSSKDGQLVRKGRGGTATAFTLAAGNTPKPVNLPINPLKKPPLAQLKKTGQSFLQVSIISFI